MLRGDARATYYEPVSYVWGEHPEFSHKLHVLVDGSKRTLAVTGNVDEMLRYLRKSMKRRHLWVDAICLNQNDPAEKAIQVPLMGEIYAQGTKMHICL
ncbi:heterokaryon incompatibility, partial [Phaeosphaeriaceae sp. PMI808]